MDHGFFAGLQPPWIMKNEELYALPVGSVFFGEVFYYVT